MVSLCYLTGVWTSDSDSKKRCWRCVQRNETVLPFVTRLQRNSPGACLVPRRRAGLPQAGVAGATFWTMNQSMPHETGSELLEKLCGLRFAQPSEAEKRSFGLNLARLQQELDWRRDRLSLAQLRALLDASETLLPAEALPSLLDWVQGCLHSTVPRAERDALFWGLVAAWERLIIRLPVSSLVQVLQRSPTSATTYNALLCALSRRSRRSDAEQLWRSLLAKRVPLAPHAISCVLEMYLRANMPEHIPMLFEKLAVHGVHLDTIALNALLHCMCRMSRVRESLVLFRIMRAHRVADTPSYNILLSMCRRLGLVSSALALKADLDSQPHLEPDALTYSLLMTLLTTADRPLETLALYREMEARKFPLTGPALNAYVGFLFGRGKFETVWIVYAKAVQACEARLQMQRTEELGHGTATAANDQVVWKRPVPPASSDETDPVPDRERSGLAKLSEPAARRQAALAGLGASAETFAHVVLACVKSLQKPEAVQAYSDMRLCGYRLNSGGYNALVELCCRSADIARGLELFAEMRRIGLEPNVTAYTLVIRDMANVATDVQRQLNAISRADIATQRSALDAKVLQERVQLLVKQALHYFAEMRSRSYAPSRMLYKALVRACAVSGQSKRLADLLLEGDSAAPAIEQLVAGELVESLLDEGHHATAVQLVEHFAALGVRLSVITCRTLIHTLYRIRDAQGILRICSLMLQHGVEINHITLRMIERALMHHELPPNIPAEIGERAQILLSRLRASQGYARP
jgi:pentatricopeptide repeat protein